ncbi:hypothetical protein Tco_0464936 [Tanacetum coccineum]
MLVQSTEDEGATSERPSEPQYNHPLLSPSEDNMSLQSGPYTQTFLYSSYSLIPFQRFWLGIMEEVTDQARKLKHLKAQIKKLRCNPNCYYTPQILDEECLLKKDWQEENLVRPTGCTKGCLYEDSQDMGRTERVVNAEKEGTEDAVSTKDVVSTDKGKKSRACTDKEKSNGNDMDKRLVPLVLDEGSSQHEPSQSFSVLKVKGEKEFELKDDDEETERPRKGKKKIEEEDESDTESEDIPEAKKKFKQLARDEEMARKLQKDWEIEEERKRIAEEKATKTALSDEYDFIQARIEADRLLALRLQDEERESSYMSKRTTDLEKILKEEDTVQVPAKVEVTEQGTKKRKGGHIKMIARKKPRKQSDVDSDDEHRKCLRIVAFEGTIDSEIMEKKSFIARLNKVSSPDGDYLVIYRANGNFRAFNYLMEVLHIFDRQDLYHLYNLMMEQYSEITLEGIELILWGDLKIMMESSTEENDQSDFWSNQQDWKIVTWRLYEACGVCILEFEDGTVIHMLVERRYPLSKELLQRMLDLGLEVERESTVAFDLIRFIKQQIDEE